MAEQRWRAADILRLGVGEGQQLVYARPTRTAQVLERPQAALLAGCQVFRTIDEHARIAAGTPPQAAATDSTARFWDRLFGQRKGQLELNRVVAISAQLETFARDGLLVEEAALRARCAAAPHQTAEPLSISTISVVTANRVESLQRCLSSYLDNARSHQRTVRFLVMDDARTADARTATHKMLSELAPERGADIVYAAADQKRKLATALTADGAIPAETIDFALFDPEGCGRSTGANHNAQLLCTAGEAFLSIDDDTTARLGPVPGAEAGLTLLSEYQTPPTRYFPDRAAAHAALSFEDRDAVAIHEALLGRRVGTCANESGRSGLLVDRLGTALLRGIEQGRAQVLATQTGLVGDAGTPNPPPLTRPAGESWARLVASESAYREAMRSREIVRGRSRLTITDNPFLSTGPAVGFDNRELLPAFFPVLRNTDGIFGLTLRTTIEHGCIAHLPWALEHLPKEPRNLPGDALTRIASRCAMNDIVTAAIHSFPVVAGGGGGDASARIAALGRHLRALGSLEDQDFLAFVRPWIWRVKGRFIAGLEEDLAEHDSEPPYWAADVRRFVESLREAMATDAYFVPDDLASAGNDDERKRVARRLVRRFGDLLEWWPAIFERARVLRADGRAFVKRL